MAVPFRYAERRPSQLLVPWIRNYWWFAVESGAPPVHHVPPDGCTALVIRLAGGPQSALLSGPWLKPLAVPVQPGERYGGVRFQPGALGALTSLDPRTLRDRIVPAPAQFAAVAAAARGEAAAAESADQMAALLDGVLATAVAGRPTRDPLVANATDRLVATAGELPIAKLAGELGVSERTLRRRFGGATGLSPKEFARIRRLLAAAWAVARGASTWSAAAHAAGYADQPHLHRDVADFTGLTPGAFGRRIRATSHDDVLP